MLLGNLKLRPGHGIGNPIISNEIVKALLKYGEYVEKTYPELGIKAGDVVRWEEMHHTYKYSKAPLITWFDWQGHCDGLAAASILYDEPQKGTTISGIEFTKNDIKALLVESSILVSNKVFGNGYQNQRLHEIDKKWKKKAFEDIYPRELSDGGEL